MKFIAFFVLLQITTSASFWNLNTFSSDWDIHSNYGNLSKDADNETHIGAITVWFFKKISNFTVELLVTTEEGDIVYNKTIKPCERRIAKKINDDKANVLGLANKDSQPGKKCPIEEGQVEVPARERSKRLPLAVSSMYSKPGKFYKNPKLVVIDQGRVVVLLQTSEHYEVQQVDD